LVESFKANKFSCLVDSTDDTDELICFLMYKKKPLIYGPMASLIYYRY